MLRSEDASLTTAPQKPNAYSTHTQRIQRVERVSSKGASFSHKKVICCMCQGAGIPLVIDAVLSRITVNPKSQRGNAGFLVPTMKPYAETFYKSKAWQDCRAAYMSKVGGLCECCLSAGRFTPAEIVHHKIELSPDNINDPTITLSFDNLEAVCRECHAIRHGARVRRYKLDEFGRATAK